MAGHSKWANIKFRKAAQDSKRGKIFTRLIREITVSARAGGGDPSCNPRLRTALDKAYGNNMAKDTVERAIKRGTGELEGIDYEEVTYEGYGPGGVAILVETLTDNKVRTVAEVRHIFAKRGGNLGTSGSVAYLFKRRGLISFPGDADEDRILEAALEAGAEDVVHEDEHIAVYTEVQALHAVAAALEAAGLKAEEVELTQIPETSNRVSGEEAEKLLKLLDALEENDDVQNVYANYEMSDEEMARIQAAS
ncbi:YebC/PmpR family DNA-binding transcriptional regulator [Acidithiobacillus sulfuriphilus]|uniref:YebC/PmpR family DNA-binding transcriptional regulator n=2 Tax=Acidithiobacillus sulfuriphilus TaxID=1867749 RepID=A0ACD5HMN8_9PROT|nr:YebC/PmpR family DNA-binding transcriptional regulator [Acidithiobacillus sulfuriphilus]MCL5980697.1 YebC/PmpR family DNA-binding transcriptional regulator [Gammaproteobacteria bacterium]RNF67311.1 YebC/PmpR family DNA-binding transcriptional regulator [Acidithiobacillus sulfuriphilus]